MTIQELRIRKRELSKMLVIDNTNDEILFDRFYKKEVSDLTEGLPEEVKEILEIQVKDQIREQFEKEQIAKFTAKLIFKRAAFKEMLFINKQIKELKDGRVSIGGVVNNNYR